MEAKIYYHGERPNKPWQLKVNKEHSVYLQDEKTAKQVKKLLLKLQLKKPIEKLCKRVAP